MSSTPTNLLKLDMRCKCAACEARTQETYLMTGSCINCGWKGTATFRKGDSAMRTGNCPSCEVIDAIRFSPITH